MDAILMKIAIYGVIFAVVFVFFISIPAKKSNKNNKDNDTKQNCDICSSTTKDKSKYKDFYQ